MTRYGMVIDLHKCVGCGACQIGCKNENNVAEGMFWSHHIIETSGAFPSVRYEYTPTLCNHCTDAACVAVCPQGAMTKDENGITVHDSEKCIGCQTCLKACPYGVINYNEVAADSDQKNEPLIEGATGSAKELEEKSGCVFPYINKDRGATYPVVRPSSTVEKCTFCDHRVKNGLLPYCVEVCPAQSRIFGDLEDTNSDVSRALQEHEGRVLKPEEGTDPAVFYIREF